MVPLTLNQRVVGSSPTGGISVQIQESRRTPENQGVSSFSGSPHPAQVIGTCRHGSEDAGDRITPKSPHAHRTECPRLAAINELLETLPEAIRTAK